VNIGPVTLLPARLSNVAFGTVTLNARKVAGVIVVAAVFFKESCQ